VFAYFSSQNYSHEKVLDVMKSDNQGLTFIWIPKLFSNVPAGSFFLALFFLALTFAAFSSLISMIELVTRIFMDTGMTRKKSVSLVAILGFLFGLPSAISMGFFNNQDLVWSIGLLFSGFFFTIAVFKYGSKKFRKEVISLSEKATKTGKWLDIVVYVFLPLQFLAMIFWWFWQSYSTDPENWLKINAESSLGTVLFQLIVAIFIFIVLNKFITKRMEHTPDEL
jgi:NSS family neurotransmitter:Na+ symporter